MHSTEYKGVKITTPNPPCEERDLASKMESSGDPTYGHFDDIIAFCKDVKINSIEVIKTVGKDTDTEFFIEVDYTEHLPDIIAGSLVCPHAFWDGYVALHPTTGYWLTAMFLYLSRDSEALIEEHQASKMYDDEDFDVDGVTAHLPINYKDGLMMTDVVAMFRTRCSLSLRELADKIEEAITTIT